jgi:hypothetical protein
VSCEELGAYGQTQADGRGDRIKLTWYAPTPIAAEPGESGQDKQSPPAPEHGHQAERVVLHAELLQIAQEHTATIGRTSGTISCARRS